MNRLPFDRRLLAPLTVAALLRFGLLLAAYCLTGTQVITQGDTSSYLDPARNLVFHGSFSSAGMPEIDRTPGYPIFAILTGAAADNILLTCAAQILLSLLSLLFVARIANLVFPGHSQRRSAGVVVAWLFAIEPLTIVSSVRVMPETLFVFLLLIVLERVLAFQRTGRLAALAHAGVFLTSATYVRPVTCYLGFFLAIGLALTAPRPRSLRWKAPAILLITCLPWLAAWQVRNYLETGYSGFSSIVEQNLYYFQSAEISAELQHISLGAEQIRLGYPDPATYLAAHPEQRDWPPSRKLRFMRAQAIEILQAHPALYLKSHFAGVGIVAITPCATELLQLLRAYPPPHTMPRRLLSEGLIRSALRVAVSHPAVAIVMAAFEAFLLFLYALAIYGCLLPDRDKLACTTLICIILYFLLISGGAQAIGRYRSPVMPELCILAAGGLAAKRKRAEP